MNFLLTWIHWGLAALLYLQSAELSKAAPALGDGERKPNEVIKFLEVYERSFCRTIETLVDIFQEYPDEVEYIFKPSCVPLMRCAGCCGDEGLECVPVDVYNVTMEIMRIKPHQSQHIAHMSFLQHSKCDCRPKKDVKNKQEKWAQKPRSDGPSFIPQTWSLHDPWPWQPFLMLCPESGKSRRMCPTRMDSRCSLRSPFPLPGVFLVTADRCLSLLLIFSCCLSEYLLASFTAAWVGSLLATGRGGSRGLVEAGLMPCGMSCWFCLSGGPGGCKGSWIS
ncbi:vascular endothelial growth factor A, long form isoform X3 [Heliangelus exortis]|uniref:vascular endothelial growth factor A, long form isoform X3 n=1 Tax=Heliangelus exortis TaxID=472823 RepID=UPI003A9212CF